MRLKRRLEYPWVIGPHEIGDYAYRISSYIDRSKLFLMSENPYSSSFPINEKPKMNPAHSRVFELFVRPWQVSELIASGASFLYIGSNSFLSDCHCLRSVELSFIKKCGGKIICVFLGSEIRSPKMFDELSEKLNMDLSTTYLFDGPFGAVAKVRMQQISDSLSNSSNLFADLILNSPIDQMANLNREVSPLFYYLPKVAPGNLYAKSRFSSGKIKVVHAPTSTLAKGTPIVRAVIKNLKEEGFDFDYVELSRARNSEVLKELGSADIVLNEFYSFLPGILGIEAMYLKCALLTSADPAIETWLPEGASKAWMRTRYWELDRNLKAFLCNPDLISVYGNAGYEWVTRNYTDEENIIRLKDILESL
jgi:hypothetical protein